MRFPRRAQELRCSFHGFCWQLDGTLKQVPCEWDFPHLDKDNFNLPEVKVATWAGFVFIDPDPAAEPLEDFLGVIAAHFEKWDLGSKFVEVHVAKRIRANWKIAQEPFSEAFHVVATHPQLLPGIGDVDSQYDVGERQTGHHGQRNPQPAHLLGACRPSSRCSTP